MKLGVDESNAGRWLNKMENEGMVERVYQNKALFWKASDGGARPQLPASPPVEHAEPLPLLRTDRVFLAEELVELERRRAEILEALK